MPGPSSIPLNEPAAATISGIEKGSGEILARDSFQNSDEKIEGVVGPGDLAIGEGKGIPLGNQKLVTHP